MKKTFKYILLVVLILFTNVNRSFGYNDLSPNELRKRGIKYVGNGLIDDTVILGCSASGGSGVVSGPISVNVPEPWRGIINSFIAKYPETDPRLVAAVLFIENQGWPPLGERGLKDSFAAARGPFQFIPDTWFGKRNSSWENFRDSSAYSSNPGAEDGNGDGIRDPEDPYDAVASAFKYHRGSKGLVLDDQYTGNPESDYSNIIFDGTGRGTNLLEKIGLYNAGASKVKSHNGIKLADFPIGNARENENVNYIKMGYWLLAYDFAKAKLTSNNWQLVDATKQGRLFGGSAESSPAGSVDNSNTVCPDSSPSSGYDATTLTCEPSTEPGVFTAMTVYIRPACATTNVKTVILAARIHGGEKSGVEVIKHVLYEAKLPPNIRIVAIPIINPLDARLSPGGVNLNRNFPVNWCGGSNSSPVRGNSNYCGPSPGSELETKRLMDIVSSERDAELLVSFHNGIYYVVASTDTGKAKQYAKTYAQYSTLPDKDKSGRTVVPQSGSLDLWSAQILRIPSLLVEASCSPDNSPERCSPITPYSAQNNINGMMATLVEVSK
jgi:hypothetical protein